MAFNLDFHSNVGPEMARKWRELAPFYFRAIATAQLFFTLAPPHERHLFSSCQLRGGAKSGASAQDCKKLHNCKKGHRTTEKKRSQMGGPLCKDIYSLGGPKQ